MSDELRKNLVIGGVRYPIAVGQSGAGAPTTATPGKEGVTYLDTKKNALYVCTAADVDAGTYTWVMVTGLYYTTTVTQPTANTIQFAQKPNISGIPIPNPVTVTLPTKFETLKIGAVSEEGVYVQSGGTAEAPALDLYGEHGDEPVRLRNLAKAVDDSDAPTLAQVREMVGNDSGDYVALPLNADGTPNYGTAGHYAVSDGAGGVTWVAAGNSGGGDSGGTAAHGIVWDLVNVTSSNSIVSVSDGASLVAVLTADSGYNLGDVTVTMGGEALTGVWNADTATVTIASVTGDVVISCAGVAITGPVDTSPVIAQENVGYGTGTDAPVINAYDNICITKPYEFTLDIDAIKESKYYDAENDYVTANGFLGAITVYTPRANGDAAGHSYTSLTTKASKIVLMRDGEARVAYSNSCLGASGETGYAPATVQFQRYQTDAMYATAVAFSLSMHDLDDSYAYWATPLATTMTPVGVRSGDIIFAGKNTEYYGMANIDGTMAGQEASSELYMDDDVAQDYAVATASILGEDTASDPSAAYGISADLAAVIDEARTAWMLAYAGDYRRIPLIVTTDQHGRRNAGIFNMLGKTLSLHDVSKIFNLGDTVSEWVDADTEHPLISDAGLESWCESIKAIPFSKRLDVFGNHDTWYSNYADEGNAIGTRYPSSQAHLNQYFRNIYARRTNNNGWFAVKDDAFNVKYVVISGFEYQGTVTFRIGTAQMQFIIDELSADDGYDVVIVSHVPLRYKSEEMTFPTGYAYTTAEDYRVSEIDTDAFFAARRTGGSGTITDSDGVEHSYDFSSSTTELLCALHGHTHHDAYIHVGGELLSHSFDWFDGNTVHFALIDRVARQLNVWKVEGETLTVTNYQVPLDKPVEDST